MRTSTRLLAALAIAVAAAAPADLAAARGGGRVVTKVGVCTGNSTSKLKLKVDDLGIETEWEVDQNRNGRLWQWKLMRGSSVLASGAKRTVAPSGSFTVRRIVTNRAGTDTIRAWAKSPTGEICRATASI